MRYDIALAGNWLLLLLLPFVTSIRHDCMLLGEIGGGGLRFARTRVLYLQSRPEV